MSQPHKDDELRPKLLYREHTRIVNELNRQENWPKLRELALEWLKDEPDSHWLLAQLSSAYYEERNYEKALETIEKALELAPHCPFVLWHYAGALDMLERADEAIRVLKGLMRRGASRIAHGRCGEGIRWARSLVNDCRYRLGLLYSRLGDRPRAEKHIRQHVAQRGRNTPSIYSVRTVKKDLAAIKAGKRMMPADFD